MLKRIVLLIVFALPACCLSQDGTSALHEPPDGVTFTIVDNEGSVLATPEPQLFGTGFDLTRILNMPVQSSLLELSDDQKAELEPRAEQIRMRFLDEYKELKDAANGKRPSNEQLEKLRRKFQDEVRLALREVLLPIQIEHLDQIEARHNFSNTRSFPVREFAIRFGLSDEQQAKLEKLTKGFDEKFQQEVAELRERRLREMFDEVLSDEQMQELDQSIRNPQSRAVPSKDER